MSNYPPGYSPDDGDDAACIDCGAPTWDQCICPEDTAPRKFAEGALVEFIRPWNNGEVTIVRGSEAIVMLAYGPWDDLESCAYDLEVCGVHGTSVFVMSVPHNALRALGAGEQE